MEQLMYHVWKYRLFDTENLRTIDDEPFEIIDTGLQNNDAGPDFFNAKLKIGDTIWVGNVEIHVNSSDWFRHNHHTNEVYDSVILNVVSVYDLELCRTNGQKIDQLIMRIPDAVVTDYELLKTKHSNQIPCGSRLRELNSMLLIDWTTALAVERIQSKGDRIKQLVTLHADSWEDAFYVVLCRSFGVGINGDGFERLARSLPFNYLQKHIDSLLQTEALLFGQAGFLEDQFDHPYYILLQREYQFLRHKFKLTPLPKSVWKLLRLRPSSFPQLKIAFLASLFHKHRRLFSIFIDADSPDKLRKLFDIELHLFWENHYQFSHSSIAINKGMGRQSIDSVLINTLAPLLFAYGEFTADYVLQERALQILESISPENNRYIRNWAEVGLVCKNAFETQALIQLQRAYCDTRKCLYCRIGHQLLSRTQKEEACCTTVDESS